MPVTVNIFYNYSPEKKYLKIQLVIFKFIKFSLLKNKPKPDKKNLKENIEMFFKYIKIIKKLNIAWDYFYLKGIYGFGDPAYTAISYGIIWSILSVIISSFKIKEPVIKLTPDCNHKLFEMHIESIFSITIGNIIRTGIFILKEEHFNG